MLGLEEPNGPKGRGIFVKLLVGLLSARDRAPTLLGRVSISVKVSISCCWAMIINTQSDDNSISNRRAVFGVNSAAPHAINQFFHGKVLRVWE